MQPETQGAPPHGAEPRLSAIVSRMQERLSRLALWFDRNVLELGRELRLAFLPPLMVYVAAGISGLTGIVGTFFVKDYLELSAAFLAAIGFWAGIPWALKMPLGHLIDLFWRWKSLFVYVGAAFITLSLLIMYGLVTERAALARVMSVDAWFVLSSLLAPIGYVIQDAVADAMTVEAVPRVDDAGRPIDAEKVRLMHTTMQTLGRVAIIGGGVVVALLNLYFFSDVTGLPEAELRRLYAEVYLSALVIPVVSVAGVLLAGVLRQRARRRLMASGHTRAAADALLETRSEPTKPNGWILGGSLAFVVFTLAVGLSDLPWNEEIIFVGSFAIVVFLLARLIRELTPEAREVLIGTAVVIFVYRAVPGPGPGATWWFIDGLGFDQAFLSVLSLIGSALALAGLFAFRRFMAERSMTYVVGFLSIAGALLSLPTLAMYHGLHLWTAAHTGGVVDARFIALVDTAVESPLGQVAMVPMLTWIANSAPKNLKATYFAVMASFSNLALSLAQLGTKYLNEIYVVTRAVKDPATGAVQTPADYSALGALLLVQLVLTLVLPFAAIAAVRALRWRTA